MRSQLASSCQRWDAKEALPILARLMRRAEDASDTHIPLLIWWALERQMRDDRDGAVDLIASADAQRSPLVREALLERVARLLAARGEPDDFKACARLFDAAPGPAEIDRLVAGIEKGLEGRRLDAVPPRSSGPSSGSGTAPRRARLSSGSRSGWGASPRTARPWSSRPTPRSPRPTAWRWSRSSGSSASPTACPCCWTWSDARRAPRSGWRSSMRSGPSSSPRWPARCWTSIPSWTAPSETACSTCSAAARRGPIAWSTRWGRGRSPPRTCVPRRCSRSSSSATRRSSGGSRRPGGGCPVPALAEKVRRIAEVRGILPEGDKGNPARGRLVFKENCATCHRLFDEGETIGPELTGAERGNLDFLLSSLVDPSSLIRNEYQAQTVALDDGRVLTGLIVEESAGSITLVDGNRQRIVLPRDAVDEMKPSAVSLMPEGQLDKLRDDQIRDLFRYLQSNGPP